MCINDLGFIVKIAKMDPPTIFRKALTLVRSEWFHSWQRYGTHTTVKRGE